MKKLKYFVLILSLCALVLLPFSNVKSSFAVSETLTVTSSTTEIVIGDKQPLEVTATLSSTQNYTSAQIEWRINDSKINAQTGISIDISSDDTSVLHIDQNWSYFSQINTPTTWVIVAKISDQITDSVTIQFLHSDVTNVTLQAMGNTIQQMSDYMTDVHLVVSWQGYPASTTITWYAKTTTNKYTKLSGSANEYVFTPTNPGEYTFKASVNGVFSQTITITIKYKTITSLKISCHKDTNNTTKLDRFTFTLENVDSNYDLDNIKWYSDQYGLMQEGGRTYTFQAEKYETVRFYAVYVDEATEAEVTSDRYPLEIEINRTKEVLIACAIILGVMTIVLVIGCVRMKKRDRIW